MSLGFSKVLDKDFEFLPTGARAELSLSPFAGLDDISLVKIELMYKQPLNKDLAWGVGFNWPFVFEIDKSYANNAKGDFFGGIDLHLDWCFNSENLHLLIGWHNMTGKFEDNRRDHRERDENYSGYYLAFQIDFLYSGFHSINDYPEKEGGKFLD
jgi:hypothetical protein